jgi:hypothetical protein
VRVVAFWSHRRGAVCLSGNAKAPHVKLKAAVVILDRTLGRPGQRLEHAGSIELRRADLVAQAKEELHHEYNAQAASARAKLHQLLERCTQAN